MKSDSPSRTGPANAPAPSGDAAPAAGPAAAHGGVAGKLRVGVLLDSWTDRAWIAKIIEDIQQSDVAEVVLVMLNSARSGIPRGNLRERLAGSLYSLYIRADRWVFRRFLKIPRDAFDPVDLRSLVPCAEVLEVTPRRTQFSDRFDEASLERINDMGLDVILRFGFRILRGDILTAARYGVWSFHHGDNRQYRGAPAMFWEMYESNRECGVTLQILTENLDGGKAIYRTTEKTNFFSLYLNRNRGYWKGTQGVLLRLRQLHSQGWPALSELDTYRETTTYTKPIYRQPGNLVMLKFLTRLVARTVGRAVSDLVTEERWFVAWRRIPDPQSLTPPTEGGAFHLLLPKRGFFYADPFLIGHQGRHYIFFEDYDYADKRGLISWIELDDQGNASQPRVAISEDCHLSYPFVFEHDGQVYMIPETRRRRRIELWRATRFPDQWAFDRVLVDDISAVDATWLHDHDKYWLFMGVPVEGATASDELHIFWSASPFGPWTPHAANPVVTTISGARPAGRVFRADQELIRPGQDGAKHYGHQVNFYRVEQLSETEYRETLIGTLSPNWSPGNLGTHTYNRDEQYEVIDGRTRILRGLRRRPKQMEAT